MYRGESDPVACWTTSTLTVTTNPSRPIIAPTTAASTALAVLGEYCQLGGSVTAVSSARENWATMTPRTQPSSGSTQRLPFRYCRSWKALAHDMPRSRSQPDGMVVSELVRGGGVTACAAGAASGSRQSIVAASG